MIDAKIIMLLWFLRYIEEIFNTISEEGKYLKNRQVFYMSCEQVDCDKFYIYVM